MATDSLPDTDALILAAACGGRRARQGLLSRHRDVHGVAFSPDGND